MNALDATERFVDAAYVQALLRVDARTARDVLRAAGGRKIGGRYRVRHSRLLAHLDGPDPLNNQPSDDKPLPSAQLTARLPSVRDQRGPTDPPPAGWWRQEAT